MSRFTNAFKAKVAIEAIRETATVQKLAKRQANRGQVFFAHDEYNCIQMGIRRE